MKKKILLTSIVIAIIIVCFYSIVIATDIIELQNKKENLENQISQANEEIENIQIELTDNLEQLNNLNSQISTHEQEIADLDSQLESLQGEIDVVSEKLELIEQDYILQKKTLEERLVTLYETGETQYLDVLLNSASFSEFISNYYMIAEIAEYDTELLDGIEKEKLTIETMQDTLTEKRQTINNLKETKQKTSIALENNKILKNKYAQQLSEDEIATQAKIDDFQTELDAVEQKIEYYTTLKVGEDYAGGELAWPAPGYTTITSPFGMRFHPIFKIYRMHSGTDIAAPTGANIVSANDGIVTNASYTTGYGNMVMINHGGGVSTVYGHGSEILVEVGQAVVRGESIMKAGSTGWSTGPHLHFEVRINGKYVDPLPYITSKAKIEEQTLQNETNTLTENTVNNVN